jgi:hypothetical protein
MSGLERFGRTLAALLVFGALPPSGLLERFLVALPPSGLLERFLVALPPSGLLERFLVALPPSGLLERLFGVPPLSGLFELGLFSLSRFAREVSFVISSFLRGKG